MNRIKRREVGTYTFTATAENEDGVAQTIVAPVTVTIRDGAGTVLVTDTPTISTGKLVYDCNASLLPNLDTYQITWTGVVGAEAQEWVTDVELVGGYLFEIADLRKEDRAFADTTKYPTDLLRMVRTAAETVIEGKKAANVAFVPRGRRVRISGPGVYDRNTAESGINVEDFETRSVYSASVGGTALTNDQVYALICDDNTIWRSDAMWPVGRKNIVIHYEHGYGRPDPAITRAALMLAREYLVKSDIPGRATATSIGDQMFRLTIAGRDGVTGIPDVDAAIKDCGRAGYKVG